MTTTNLPLPPLNSPSITLALATPSEALAQTKANSEAWAGALDLATYLRREDLLSNQALTRDGGLTTWVLVWYPDGQPAPGFSPTAAPPTDAPGKNEDRPRIVLCGCETIRKRALAVVPTSSSSSQPGKKSTLTETLAHGVCSVFCPATHRGHGYAGRMIEELGRALEHWQVSTTDADDDNGPHPVNPDPRDGERPRALFSVLYSDIGKKFYAARGYRVFPSAHVSLPAAAAAAAVAEGDDREKKGLEGVRMLRAEDLPALCAADEEGLRRRLARRAAKGSSPSAAAVVALVPDLATIGWHHAREEFVAAELFGPSRKPPEVKGALVQLPDGKDGSAAGSRRAWCYWTRVWSKENSAEDPNVLHILRLVVEGEDEDGEQGGNEEVVEAVAKLFRATRREARDWGMREVWLWNPAEFAVTAAKRAMDGEGVKVVDREEESITSLRWYGAPEMEGKVEWICNEKYGWC